ncbi:MAG: chorismate-binding protein [Ignavibacteria bacterium]|nr:chorismate-binding protein [Ignavibacteria bacterium]
MNFDEFKELAQSYNVIPVSKTLLADMLTPVSAYLRLRSGSKGSFLFESVEGGERFARYSFIGRDPHTILKCKSKRTSIIEKDKQRESTENFLDITNNVIAHFRHPSIPGLPRFTGGLVGFIGYDAIRFIEDIPETASDTLHFDDSILGLFTSIVVFDHYKHQIIIIVNVVLDERSDLRHQFDETLREISNVESLLWQSVPEPQRFHSHADQLSKEMSPDEFHSIVRKAKQYIAFNAYRTLRVVNPSPYLYYLDFGGFKVIGSSPEILVRMEGNTAEVYPIAGTRHRGTSDAEDQRLERELLADQKERAEHVMLVDLGRNDLGRVCEPGTVHVDQLMTIVRYSHVMHIASRVVGTITKGKTCVDVLKATFPAGTVSGAPKIRAMEIIDELEGARRGIYAGGVGYLDFSGNMDMCIAIRTMFAVNGRIYLQAGAGIVADSDPETEYQETINKARALVEALHMAERIS